MLGTRVKLIVHALFAMSTLSLVNCTADSRSIIAARLTEGSSIGGLVGDADSAAVVLADPADCLSCNYPLYTLLQARRYRAGVVYLVLSRLPSDVERRQLALQHIQPDAVMRDSRYTKTFGEPMVVTIVRRVASSPLKLVQARPFIRALLREAVDTASASTNIRR